MSRRAIQVGAAAASAIGLAVLATGEVRDRRLAGTIELAIRCRIPDDLPAEATYHFKDGTTRKGNPRDTYCGHFAAGWGECLTRFVSPAHPGWNPAPLDPYDERTGPRLKAIFGYDMDAQRAGFRDCRAQLKDLAGRFGTDRARRAVRRKYGADWMAVEEFVRGQQSDRETE